MGRKRKTGTLKIKFLKTLFVSPTVAVECGTIGELERREDHFALRVGNAVVGRYDYKYERHCKKYIEIIEEV